MNLVYEVKALKAEVSDLRARLARLEESEAEIVAIVQDQATVKYAYSTDAPEEREDTGTSDDEVVVWDDLS